MFISHFVLISVDKDAMIIIDYNIHLECWKVKNLWLHMLNNEINGNNWNQRFPSPSPLKPFVDREKVKGAPPSSFPIFKFPPLCTPSSAPEENKNEEENIPDSPELSPFSSEAFLCAPKIIPLSPQIFVNESKWIEFEDGTITIVPLDFKIKETIA